MDRTKVFNSKARNVMVYKSLRHNAREAAEYLTGRIYTGPGDNQEPVDDRSPRGASGESSN